jgi:hypothetical protein
MSTTDKDLGYARLLQEMKKANGAILDVGIFDGETQPASDGEPLSVAQIGAVHEFGSDDGRVPRRPWMSTAVDEKRSTWFERFDRFRDRFLQARGAIPFLHTLTAAGEFCASDVRLKITEGPWKEKAPATLAREGQRFTRPLIWLGYMRAVVRSRIVMMGVRRMTPKEAPSPGGSPPRQGGR